MKFSNGWFNMMIDTAYFGSAGLKNINKFIFLKRFSLKLSPSMGTAFFCIIDVLNVVFIVKWVIIIIL